MVRRIESWRSVGSPIWWSERNWHWPVAQVVCFVATHVAISNFNLINSSNAVLAVMICGASGFYLGIDLAPAPEKAAQLQSNGRHVHALSRPHRATPRRYVFSLN